jgi:hypothetical protein
MVALHSRAFVFIAAADEIPKEKVGFAAPNLDNQSRHAGEGIVEELFATARQTRFTKAR